MAGGLSEIRLPFNELGLDIEYCRVKLGMDIFLSFFLSFMGGG